MKNYILLVLFCFVIVSLISCSEDKGNETMPLNVIKGSYEPQLNFLNQALEEDPDDDELLCKRSRVYFNMYRYSDALNDIKAAIKVKSDNGEYYLLLSQINFSMKNYFESIKASEKAEGLGIENPELLILQARVYWETGDTTRSTLYLRKMEVLAPFHSDVNLLKGKQAAYRTDTLKAVTYFLQAVKSDRKNIDAYRNLIYIYINKGKEDSALFYTLQAREIDPHNPDFYYLEGKVFQKKELKQSAMLSYWNCLKYDSVYAPAILQLGQLYYKDNNTTQAFNYLKKYTMLENNNKEVYRIIIKLLTDQNNEHKTIPYYERLIQLDSNNTALKYTLEKLYKLYAVNLTKDTASQKIVIPTTIPVLDTIKRRRISTVKRDSIVRPSVVDTLR